MTKPLAWQTVKAIRARILEETGAEVLGLRNHVR